MQSLPRYTWMAQRANVREPATKQTEPNTRTALRKRVGGRIIWGRKNVVSHLVAVKLSSQ